MRWLEGTPERYDVGMRIITLGRVARLHDAVANAAAPEPGRAVLEIGCGTGAVTERLVARGAHVTALDQNPEMLEQARLRLQSVGSTATASVQWLERTASEIDTLPRGAFDSVVLSLSLSEMSRDERRFVFSEARERLAASGRLVAADEVRAARAGTRLLQIALRGPQSLLAWLLAGSGSKPLADLRGEIERAGFRVLTEERWLAASLALFVAEPAA